MNFWQRQMLIVTTVIWVSCSTKERRIKNIMTYWNSNNDKKVTKKKIILIMMMIITIVMINYLTINLRLNQSNRLLIATLLRAKKMAERESAHGSGRQTKDRKRKQNFSVYEFMRLKSSPIMSKKKSRLNPIQMNKCCDQQKETNAMGRNNPSGKCGRNSQANSHGGKRQVEKSP